MARIRIAVATSFGTTTACWTFQRFVVVLGGAIGLGERARSAGAEVLRSAPISHRCNESQRDEAFTEPRIASEAVPVWCQGEVENPGARPARKGWRWCSANSLAKVLFPAAILPQRNISVAEVFMLSAGFHARPRLNVRFLPGRRSWVLAFLTRPRALGAVPLVANLCASLGSTERGAACGVVIGRVELAIARRFATCVDFYEVAPRAGLEPATLRLTAGCSAIELPRIR
jgi:hypothetical protein